MDLKFIDSHCHVHFQAYKADMDDIVQRSLAAGVGMITVGTQSTTSKNGLALAEKYEGVWCTIGLHPNHLHAQDFFDEDELDPEDEGTTDGRRASIVVSEGALDEPDARRPTYDKLDSASDEPDARRTTNVPPHIKTRAERFDWDYYRTLAKHPKVIAVGELGLDYYRVPPGIDIEQLKHEQKEQAREQLRFATEVDKPVVIHCRDAHADQAELLQEELDRGGLKRRGVIHCFTGTAEEAARYHELGFYVSFTGIVTFGKNVMEAARQIPLEQILIETDSPYLTPAPYRGQRNEPKHVEFVAQKIAELKGVSVDEVARVTTENATQLFRLV